MSTKIFTYAVATRFRSSGATFFLRGLTGRRCIGDGVEVEEVSGFADEFDGLGMFWHRVCSFVQRTDQLNDGAVYGFKLFGVCTRGGGGNGARSGCLAGEFRLGGGAAGNSSS